MDLSSLICGMYVGILIGIGFVAWIARDSEPEVVVPPPAPHRMTEGQWHPSMN